MTDTDVDLLAGLQGLAVRALHERPAAIAAVTARGRPQPTVVAEPGHLDRGQIGSVGPIDEHDEEQSAGRDRIGALVADGDPVLHGRAGVDPTAIGALLDRAGQPKVGLGQDDGVGAVDRAKGQGEHQCDEQSPDGAPRLQPGLTPDIAHRWCCAVGTGPQLPLRLVDRPWCRGEPPGLPTHQSPLYQNHGRGAPTPRGHDPSTPFDLVQPLP